MANWRRFNSIQFIRELQYKMLQIDPFAPLPQHVHLNLANQLQSSHLFDVAGTSKSYIDFQ